MPKTKFQEIIFTIIMVLVMVYCMTLYNMVLEFGQSFSVFKAAFWGMWQEAGAAFILQRLIAGPIAKKLAFKIVKPGSDKSVFVNLVMAFCTVSLMAPMMTLYVSIFHNGLVKNLLFIWMLKLAFNFPFALFSQVIYVGPFVRFIYGNISKTKLLSTV